MHSRRGVRINDESVFPVDFEVDEDGIRVVAIRWTPPDRVVRGENPAQQNAPSDAFERSNSLTHNSKMRSMMIAH